MSEKREEQELVVLCGANAYRQKYYLNPDFVRLPDQVKKELQIMCVSFTEDVGGVVTLGFDGKGSLKFQVGCADGDTFFDEIGSALKIGELQRTKGELLRGLELYYQALKGYSVQDET